jgi:hypothetical protein
MWKPLVTVAGAGVLGFALWKVLSVLLLPLVGTLVGIVATVLKVALFVGLVLFLFWLFRGKPKEERPAD